MAQPACRSTCPIGIVRPGAPKSLPSHPPPSGQSFLRLTPAREQKFSVCCCRIFLFTYSSERRCFLPPPRVHISQGTHSLLAASYLNILQVFDSDRRAGHLLIVSPGALSAFIQGQARAYQCSSRCVSPPQSRLSPLWPWPLVQRSTGREPRAPSWAPLLSSGPMTGLGVLRTTTAAPAALLMVSRTGQNFPLVRACSERSTFTVIDILY